MPAPIDREFHQPPILFQPTVLARADTDTVETDPYSAARSQVAARATKRNDTILPDMAPSGTPGPSSTDCQLERYTKASASSLSRLRIPREAM